jgi:hypothetical protein
MNITLRQLTSRPLADGRCRVLLDITWDSQRLKLASGVRCLPAHFSPAAKPGKHISTKDPNSSALNNKLAQLLADVSQVFHLADAHKQPVTPEQLTALVQKKAPSPALAAAAGEPGFADLLAQWQREHPGSTKDAKRRYVQVVGHLETYFPAFSLSDFSRKLFHEYLAYLQAQGLADTTIRQHINFLRACYRLRELAAPTWLQLKVRVGRAPALRQEELQALRDAIIPPQQQYLVRERERLLFQTQMLLRDSDLRRLQPHHVSEQPVPGHGVVPTLELYQQKTGDAVRLPLPPLAASIWQAWAGKVPVVSQQKRNEYLKQLGELAGLDRTFVRVRFRGGVAHEEPLPLWQVLSTHTPRHSGADLVLWGSKGDHNLKEAALGHAAGASVYGHDTFERYAPLLLEAWQQVGALAVNAPTPAPKPAEQAGRCAPAFASTRPVLARFSATNR